MIVELRTRATGHLPDGWSRGSGRLSPSDSVLRFGGDAGLSVTLVTWLNRDGDDRWEGFLAGLTYRVEIDEFDEAGLVWMCRLQ